MLRTSGLRRPEKACLRIQRIPKSLERRGFMSITAKELARRLNISETAVSLALNNKPGISQKRKKEILAEAEKAGYDFTRVKHRRQLNSSVCFVIYRKHGAVVSDTPFFAELYEGIQETCRELGLKLRIRTVFEGDDTWEQLEAVRYDDISGMIVLATEMQKEDLNWFSDLPFPAVFLDACFLALPYDAVVIDNVQGAYTAVSYLIRKTRTQPGYLRSAYSISNFEERADGFYKAVRENGLYAGKSPVHRLTPSVEGAYEDMKALLKEGLEPARSYFADNDLIAIGAVRAFQEAGYDIPKDISIAGFDNLPIGNYIKPSLSTVNVPKKAMASLAVTRLKEIMTARQHVPVRILTGVSLVRRDSV